MVLPAHIGYKRASFAIDTGAAVNALSESSYLALKRTSRGGKYPLLPTDKHLVGVSKVPLNILGIVRLPVCLRKNSKAMRLDFYVISNFSLPSDGLLGLETLKAHNIDILPTSSSVRSGDRYFRAMTSPRPLITPNRPPCHSNLVPSMSDVSPSTRQNSPPLKTHPAVSSGSHIGISTLSQDWRQEKVIVQGTHTVPARTAAYLPVIVRNATEGTDICIEGPSKLSTLSVEPTLNTIAGDGTTSALVVNASNATVKVKSGLYLSQALVYTQKVEPDGCDLPTACVAPVSSHSEDIESDTGQSLHSFVSAVDYPESKQALLGLLNSYRDVIALPGEPLGNTPYAQHFINLKANVRPVYVPAYRLPHSQREVVDRQIEDMLKEGVIQPSRSPWNSPLFLVPKKTGGFRPVIDFRKVNKVTEDDRFPLPVLKDLLMSLGGGNAVYSSLDLLSGYWQVPLAPESREITAFSTPNGHYEWLRMPFGLKSAPITFQRLMNTLFAPMLGKHVYAYMDDVIIFSEDIPSHFKHLESVLLKLREAALKVKITKCEFLRKSLKFLGHVVDREGIHTMDDKIEAIKHFPTPKSVENVRSFLGLSGYYRCFVKNFSSIASPLNSLLKKDTPFHWGVAQERSFKLLKHALTHAPILVFPDYKKPFILYTDASALGLGAVLMQLNENGKHRVIAYASRTLNSAETNYSVTHQEALAIVWALSTFRDIIYGYKIICYTDHTAVTHLFEGRKLSGRLARWDLTIQDFNPTFRYVPGRANKVADSLSRNIPVGSVSQPNSTSQVATEDDKIPRPGPFTIRDLHIAQRAHDTWGMVIHHLESGDDVSIPSLRIPLKQFYLNSDGLLCRHWDGKSKSMNQTVIPEKYVPTVLHFVHDAAIAGHPGKERTLMAARRKYFWPTMRVDIDDHVNRCHNCAQYKGMVPKPAPILTYPPPSKPWEVVGIDVLQLPSSRQGSRYLLVCVDHFSRYTVLVPLKDKTAGEVAHALVTKVFLVHSAPKVLLSDNGGEFRNALLNEICSQYQITQAFITAYHAASNGLSERANKKVLEAIRPIVGPLHSTWEDWIPHVASSINSSVCESTGFSPHFILYGCELRLPYDLLDSPSSPVYNVEDYSKAHLKVFADIHKQVRNQLTLSKAALCTKQHKIAAPIELKAGDKVMVLASERRSKLSPKFIGPRVIVKQLHGNKFEVLDPLTNTTQHIHNDHLKRTDTPLPTTNPARTQTQSLPKADDQGKSSPTHSYSLRQRPTPRVDIF